MCGVLSIHVWSFFSRPDERQATKNPAGAELTGRLLTHKLYVMTSSNIAQLRMTDQSLRRRIAELAADSNNIVLTAHAKQRMRARRISLTQVQRVLLRGNIVEPAHKDIKGCWKCTLQLLIAGDTIRVAAALGEDANKNKVIVVTVMH